MNLVLKSFYVVIIFLVEMKKPGTGTRVLHVIKFLHDDNGCFNTNEGIGYESPSDYLVDRNPKKVKFSEKVTELELSFNSESLL